MEKGGGGTGYSGMARRRGGRRRADEGRFDAHSVTSGIVEVAGLLMHLVAT